MCTQERDTTAVFGMSKKPGLLASLLKKQAKMNLVLGEVFGLFSSSFFAFWCSEKETAGEKLAFSKIFLDGFHGFLAKTGKM